MGEQLRDENVTVNGLTAAQSKINEQMTLLVNANDNNVNSHNGVMDPTYAIVNDDTVTITDVNNVLSTNSNNLMTLILNPYDVTEKFTAKILVNISSDGQLLQLTAEQLAKYPSSWRVDGAHDAL